MNAHDFQNNNHQQNGDNSRRKFDWSSLNNHPSGNIDNQSKGSNSSQFIIPNVETLYQSDFGRDVFMDLINLCFCMFKLKAEWKQNFLTTTQTFLPFSSTFKIQNGNMEILDNQLFVFLQNPKLCVLFIQFSINCFQSVDHVLKFLQTNGLRSDFVSLNLELYEITNRQEFNNSKKLSMAPLLYSEKPSKILQGVPQSTLGNASHSQNEGFTPSFFQREQPRDNFNLSINESKSKAFFNGLQPNQNPEWQNREWKSNTKPKILPTDESQNNPQNQQVFNRLYSKQTKDFSPNDLGVKSQTKNKNLENSYEQNQQPFSIKSEIGSMPRMGLNEKEMYSEHKSNPEYYSFDKRNDLVDQMSHMAVQNSAYFNSKMKYVNPFLENAQERVNDYQENEEMRRFAEDRFNQEFENYNGGSRQKDNYLESYNGGSKQKNNPIQNNDQTFTLFDSSLQRYKDLESRLKSK